MSWQVEALILPDKGRKKEVFEKYILNILDEKSAGDMMFLAVHAGDRPDAGLDRWQEADEIFFSTNCSFAHRYSGKNANQGVFDQSVIEKFSDYLNGDYVVTCWVDIKRFRYLNYDLSYREKKDESLSFEYFTIPLITYFYSDTYSFSQTSILQTFERPIVMDLGNSKYYYRKSGNIVAFSNFSNLIVNLTYIITSHVRSAYIIDKDYNFIPKSYHFVYHRILTDWLEDLKIIHPDFNVDIVFTTETIIDVVLKIPRIAHDYLSNHSIEGIAVWTMEGLSNDLSDFYDNLINI